MSVLLAGATSIVFNSLEKKGFDISVFFYTDGRKPAVSDNIFYRFYEDLFHPVSCEFCDDVDEIAFEDVRSACYGFFVRTYYRLPERQYPKSESWLDFNNIFESYMQYYYTILSKNKINHVIFGKIPHQGSVIILYFLARALNIRCTLLMQSIFPNGFWAFDSLGEIGQFKGEADPCVSIPILDVPSPPHYMKGVKKHTFSNFFWKHLKYNFKKLFKIVSLSHLYNQKSLSKINIKIRDNVRLYNQHNLPVRYFSAFKRDDLYIYFPLHLQPEMTTDILGGVFCDQILAIEQLSRTIPKDYFIYVKENPKQSTYMRDNSFYSRLLSIPNVKYVNVDTSSYDLIRHAKAIATITGTAGWEALQMNKPVICFGLAWYRNLYGVLEWKNADKIKINKILSMNFQRELLKNSVVGLQKFLHPGVIDQNYASLMADFDPAKNASLVAESLLRYDQRRAQ